MSSNDHPRGEDPACIRFMLELATLSPADLAHLFAYARHRRRLWMVAIPGLGLLLLP